MSCPQRIWELWAQILLVPAAFSSLLATSPPAIFFFFDEGEGRGNTSRIRQYLQHGLVCGYSLNSVASCTEASQTHDSYYSPHAHCRGCFPLCLGSLACTTEKVDDKAERYAEYSTLPVTSPADCFLNPPLPWTNKSPTGECSPTVSICIVYTLTREL